MLLSIVLIAALAAIIFYLFTKISILQDANAKLQISNFGDKSQLQRLETERNAFKASNDEQKAEIAKLVESLKKYTEAKPVTPSETLPEGKAPKNLLVLSREGYDYTGLLMAENEVASFIIAKSSNSKAHSDALESVEKAMQIAAETKSQLIVVGPSIPFSFKTKKKELSKEIIVIEHKSQIDVLEGIFKFLIS